MSSQLPFNSWFIDCDATGEIYDDYTPSHITTQEEDLAARLERMSYIRDPVSYTHLSLWESTPGRTFICCLRSSMGCRLRSIGRDINSRDLIRNFFS